jgi:hypothetical protein
MRTYLVGYDLNRPRGNDDYPDLHKAIKGFGTWWHHLDSTWIIKTNMSAAQIRDALKKHIDSGDELLVVRLAGEGAWTGFNDKGSQWLKDNLSYE